MTEMIYTYDGSFEGFLCCIFDSYSYKEVLTAICCDEDFAPTLFDCRSVRTDRDHAGRVLRKIVKCSPYAAELLRKGFHLPAGKRAVPLPAGGEAAAGRPGLSAELFR